MPLCFLSELGQCICCPETVTKTEVSSSYIFVHYYTLLQCKHFQISHPNPWTEQELVHNTTTLFSNTFHKSLEKRKKRKKYNCCSTALYIWTKRTTDTQRNTLDKEGKLRLLHPTASSISLLFDIWIATVLGQRIWSWRSMGSHDQAQE